MCALVRNDGLHHGRLADDTAGGFQSLLGQVLDQSAHADAADFLVVRQRQVQRRIGIGCQVFGHHDQCRGDVAFHVGHASPIELVTDYGGLEGVGVPGLALDGHDVGVTRQHQARPAPAADGGEQVSFFTRRVVGQPRGHPQAGQIVARPLDQAEVGVTGDGGERDQALDHAHHLGRRL